MTKIAIFNEFSHERENEAVKKIYPNGIHSVIKDFLFCDNYEVITTTLDDYEQVLTPEFLETVDVLIWWGHKEHNKVSDEVAKIVCDAVHSGMGFLPLHSAHHSKPFIRLMGTPCHLSWRGSDFERIWTVDPSHPVAQGVGRYFELEQEETYAEPFSVPEPDKVVFLGWYAGGEVFRSGCCYQRGHGKIFYFQPGHESFPTYYNETVQLIIKNAIEWLKPVYRAKIDCPHVKRIGEEDE